jgi:Short C-terminal domain
MLRRRPVARTVARTAVVAGTATAVSGNVARRQAARHAPAEPAPAPPPPAAPAPPPAAAPAAPAADPMEQLTKLAALKQQGLLTDEEFATQKAKLLDQI